MVKSEGKNRKERHVFRKIRDYLGGVAIPALILPLGDEEVADQLLDCVQYFHNHGSIVLAGSQYLRTPLAPEASAEEPGTKSPDYEGRETAGWRPVPHTFKSCARYWLPAKRERESVSIRRRCPRFFATRLRRKRSPDASRV